MIVDIIGSKPEGRSAIGRARWRLLDDENAILLGGL
jgi:hypothetical protein